MLTDSNSNGIIGKSVVDPFCDGNGNGKKHIYMQYVHGKFMSPADHVISK